MLEDSEMLWLSTVRSTGLPDVTPLPVTFLKRSIGDALWSGLRLSTDPDARIT